MENDSPLLNASGKNRPGCYAALPGGGPAGQVCARCAFSATQGKQMICSQYATLTGRRGGAINPSSAACRYYSARPAYNAAPAR
jgi:hypothetical protein